MANIKDWLVAVAGFAVLASCSGTGGGSATTSGRRDPVGTPATGALSAESTVGIGDGSRAPTTDRGESTVIVMDDFESGTLAGWRSAGGGSGSWYVYSDGNTPPDPADSDPNVPFNVPHPPQGEHAAVTDMAGPGTRILYRDVVLEGRFILHVTVFHVGSAPFASAPTLAFDRPDANQQFRIDLIDPSAPIDSVAKGDVRLNVFHTSPGDPVRLEPTDVAVDVSALAGETIRLRLAGTDNAGPLRVGVDNIRFQPVDTDTDARVEFPATAEASNAIDLVLRRMSEAEALAALSDRARQRADQDEFAGAVLVARDGKVLLEEARGLADREAGTPNTPDTKFRIGSMNKMFTAAATLQLVEAGVLALDDPIGKHLPDYPNKEMAENVTVRQLLTHTGGTGDIFGPQFDRNRLSLREHADYINLYGQRAPGFEPGSRFEYSNYGFVLLGALIEAVTGQTYYEYVRHNIFQPAGMTSTGSLPETDDVPNRSIGYMRVGDDWVPNTDTLPWRGTAAGGGYSTVGDLNRFAQALNSGTLLSKRMLGEATRPHTEGYGYGFGVGLEPAPFYGHSGGAPGQNGDLRIYPDLGYVVVALANLDPPAADSLVNYFTLRMPID
jgi:CubicO group peptidase (beta-lactamase class C family)